MAFESDDCYEYMRLTHTLAVCWGLPIIRKQISVTGEPGKKSTVKGHRYSYDARVVPVWLTYVAMDAFIIFYNYREASGYVGESFKKCFEESYCFAVIELINRNVGPFSALVCFAFGARRHKVAALAGTERVLAFIRRTNAAAPRAADGLSPAVRYHSAAVLAAYTACIWMYAAAVPPVVVLLYWANALSQTAACNLTVLQYYVLERGYARVNRLLETTDVRGDPRSAARALHRLCRTCDHLGRVVDHVNRAYVTGMLLRWPYTVIRVIMVVFRIIELTATMQAGHRFAHVAAVLVLEHVFEIFMFLQQLSYFCATGARLSEQAVGTLASLQKLKLCHGFKLDLEVRKMVNIFWIQVNARRVNATIGGYIIMNMNFMKTICGIIATYFLVLIQFKFQKGKSNPLHQLWN